jgi:hypothetical protein
LGSDIVGGSLILGAGTRIASYFGAGLLFLYYVSNPPFLSSILFVDKNLVELFAFLVISAYPTSDVLGLDVLIKKIRK